MYRIAEEICNGNYPINKIYISVHRHRYKQILSLINTIKNKNKIKFIIVFCNEKSNYKAYATCKYFFTDNDFHVDFIKRDGQVIVQTWHGTPLKKLGFDFVHDIVFVSNQKRAFAEADYCLFPNEFTMEHMINSYRLNNMLKGKILLDGYPRNTIFFDSEKRKKTIKKYKLQNKKVYVFMPTWRGVLVKNENKNQNDVLLDYLHQIDKKLTNEEILFTKLHRINTKNIDFSKFKHIKQFPTAIETYEFLNIADCLITDYSSVMFDFANSGKKIVLFAYDQEEYLENHGMYFDYEKLPFPIVDNVDDLINEIHLPKQYDDKAFMAEFCPYDNKNSTVRLLNQVILNKECNTKIIEPIINNKKNILLFAGNLLPSKATEKFLYFLDNLNTNDANYYIGYLNFEFKNKPERMGMISKKFNLLGACLKREMYFNLTLNEAKLLEKFLKCGKLTKKSEIIIKSAFRREFNNQFFNIKWDEVIHFSGHNWSSLALLASADAKRTLVLQNDGFEKNHKDFNRILNYCIENFDKVEKFSDNFFEI